MARPATGSIREKRAADGAIIYLARFTAPDVPGGRPRRQELPLGRSPEWTRRRAETELQNILADVRRGIWHRPTKRTPAAPADPDPTIHVLASDWVALKRPNWVGGTEQDYLWQVQNHILRFWADYRVSEVTVEEFDRFVSHLRGQKTTDPATGRRLPGYRKADGQPLARSSVNSIIERMAQILDLAVRRSNGKLPNVARLPGTKVPADKRGAGQRKFNALEVDELLEALAVAGEMEHSSKRADYRHIGRRALFAVLVYAGLRVSEACRLRWRDVDLAGGILKVGVLSGDGKTVASVRVVNIVPALREELAAWKATTRYGSVKDYVITTAVGTRRDKDNARQRVVDPVLARINELRAEADRDPFPDFTTHTGRRTFATHLIAIGEMPDYVQDQLGHEDPTLAMRVYRQRRSVRAAPDPRLFELYGRPHHLA